MTAPAKIIVIGIDSGDRELIAKWAGEGYLPTFKRLINEATTGQIDNPHALEAGSVWPTFHTGVGPAKHGQYEGMRIFDPEIYDHRALRLDEMSPRYYWRHLNKNGKRICLIDPEYMRMANEPVNGTLIFDWAVHAPSHGGTQIEFWTQPPELKEQIESRYGKDPLEGQMCDVHKPRTLEQQRWFRDGLIERARRKGEVAVEQLSQGGWDYFEVIFCDTHCAGHHCWHLHDKEHPDYDPQVVAALGGDPLRDVYAATDKAVGKVIEAAGPEATVIVYCSHGMGAEYSGTRMLDRMLVALEGQKPANYRNPVLNAARTAWRGLPKGLRRGLKPMQRRAWTAMMNDGFQPNRRQRRYFEVYLNNRSAGVRINLKGREPNGIVEPGEEYDRLLAELSRDLLAFTNIETGKPVVVECLPIYARHEGEKQSQLPDLAVTWDTSAPIRQVSSPKSGEVLNEDLTARSGDHRPIGQFFAIGPGLDYRQLNEPVNSVDFVPSFSKMLNIPVPDGDGKPIEALCRPGIAQAAE